MSHRASSKSRPCHWLALFGALAAVSCAPSQADETVTGRRSFKDFRANVYPVLLRDCGFPTCHGDPARFFRVWGPGRTRLTTETLAPEPFDDPTGDELSASQSLALAFIDDSQPGDSQLLRKPLAPAAGGAAHGGIDAYGRNIYRTDQDPGWQALALWAYSLPPPLATP